MRNMSINKSIDSYTKSITSCKFSGIFFYIDNEPTININIQRFLRRTL